MARFCPVIFLFLLKALVDAQSVYSFTTLASKPTSIKSVCITKYQSGSGSLESLPVSTRNSTFTKTRTQYETEPGQTTTLTVTPGLKTTTTTISRRNITTPRTDYTTVTKAVGGACKYTATVAVKPLTTVYTGTYDGISSVTTVTAASHVNAALRLKAPAILPVQHFYGYGVDSSVQEPHEVDCLVHKTTTITITTKLANQTTTVLTTLLPSTAFLTLSQPQVASTDRATVTRTVTIAASGVSNCTTTVGSATSTTTQHIKCAPTNLVSSINGQGIGQTQGETFGLAPGSDPSACCQLCVDTPDCAASEDDQKAGNCFLWYTKNPTCGLGLKYSAGSKQLAPGNGLFVQTGCGSIAPA